MSLCAEPSASININNHIESVLISSGLSNCVYKSQRNTCAHKDRQKVERTDRKNEEAGTEIIISGDCIASWMHARAVGERRMKKRQT